MGPPYAAGVFASILLVPVLLVRLHADGGDPARYEAVLSGAPSATWLDEQRIVGREVAAGPAASAASVAAMTTTVRPSGAGAAALAAPAVSTSPASVAATTTTVAFRPPSTVPAATTTTSPVQAPRTTSTPPPPVTTTTTAAPLVVLPGPVAATELPFGTHSQRGVASWFNAPDGTCAHTSIPRGTVVRVTRLHNGASTTCTIADWGPADASRIIDLSMDTFQKLASTEAGLIDVLIEW